MAAPNPLRLSTTTRFPPSRLRAHSRSPSRSPVRKSQFLARELDPLLNNLSPDSTLKALQATSAIANDGASQDVLTKSITDASPAEREIGIRAAVAAQKLKQWRNEVESWTWPDRRGRGRGAGFLPPKRESMRTSPEANQSYLGSLPVQNIREYEERIEDIRDGIEALELEDIKDHVFSAHAPKGHQDEPSESPQVLQPAYGRMRDFTALVTATVVQALPDMANLSTLLDTWDIRLAVLRQSTSLEKSIQSTRSGIDTAASIVRDPETGPLVTHEEYDMTKMLLGEKVATVGAKVDKMLDLLEGQEDTLPHIWIESLEDIENDYAAWVVETEHIVAHNESLRNNDEDSSINLPRGVTELPIIQPISPLVDPSMSRQLDIPTTSIVDTSDQDVKTSIAELPSTDRDPSEAFPFLRAPPEISMSRRKPSPNTMLPNAGHNRGVSEVSMAESALSGVSDLSQAEIVDASSTKMLTSSGVRLVENRRSSRDELNLFPSPEDVDSENMIRPPMLQRASTASFEVIPKDQVRHVMLQKSKSHDALGSIAQSPPSTPSTALNQLTGTDTRRETQSRASELEGSPVPSASRGLGINTELSAPHQPNSLVDPFTIEPDKIENKTGSPKLPRRSSKRVSIIEPGQKMAFMASHHPSGHDVFTDSGSGSPHREPSTIPAKSPREFSGNESLEDRIKDILTALPTQIRLGSELDINNGRQPLSVPSSRSSTPVPALTLSPVKADRSNRKATPGDVRLFHLTRTGQSRDVPPVKLFVRAVGDNGERVMVRVGGGWADLAEYLREYSLHHGHRMLSNGNMEVAMFPGSNTANDITALPNVDAANSMTRSGSPVELSTKGRSLESSGLSIGKLRKSSRGDSIDPHNVSPLDPSSSPPVPAIPPGYNGPKLDSFAANTTGVVNSSVNPAGFSMSTGQKRAVSSPMYVSNTTNEQFNPIHSYVDMQPATGSRYTPLGAAGPISNGRRIMSQNATRDANKDAWVEGVVDQARAVSNSNTTTTTVHSPTITTTMRTISKSTPASRRVSAITNSSPESNITKNSPSPSISTNNSSSSRSKSRLSSLGDVSGIKRVFLRRKTSKQ